MLFIYKQALSCSRNDVTINYFGRIEVTFSNMRNFMMFVKCVKDCSFKQSRKCKMLFPFFGQELFALTTINKFNSNEKLLDTVYKEIIQLLVK